MTHIDESTESSEIGNRDIDEVMKKRDSSLDQSKTHSRQRISVDCVGYGKAIEAFSRQCSLISPNSDAAAQKALYGFGKETIYPISKGRKKKLISFQFKVGESYKKSV